MKRATQYAQADFPLTTATIQYSVMETHLVIACRELEESDIHTIRRHDCIRMVFTREQFPGLKRAASVILNLPEGIFVKRATNYGVSQINFHDPDDSANYIIPNITGMDDSDRAAVTAWVNQAVQAKRLQDLTLKSVDYIMDDVQQLTKTTAHLHYFWPNLAKLVNKRASDDISKFVGRFQHLPRYKKPYLPPVEIATLYASIIKVADMVITKGMELPNYEEDFNVVRAEVEQWEEREGDTEFPVVIDF